MSEKNEKPSAEIIQGPWGKTKRKVKLPDKDVVAMQENLAFADDLTETLMVQLIHTLHEITDKMLHCGYVINQVKHIATELAETYEYPLTSIL